MDRLEKIVTESLNIAERAMQKEGFANPKVTVFFRDEKNELGTYMIDLAPQSYFDNREEIMKKVGVFIAGKKQEGIRSFDTLIYTGEALVTIDGEQKQALIATALTNEGKSALKVKEIQKYILAEHPEKQFSTLSDLELKKSIYVSPVLQALMNSYKNVKQ